MGNNKQYDPIVFVNRPISDPTEDIVGFGTQVKEIEAAVEKGATMIGVIANYGTGKSSVTDMLEGDIRKTEKEECLSLIRRKTSIIKINMWDCLQKTEAKEFNQEAATKEVTNLTKSLLFQMALGKSKKFAEFINKRLSKNYGIVSLSSNTIKIWIYLVLAGIFYAIYQIFGQDSLSFINDAKDKAKDILLIVKDISPLFLLGSFVCLALGIKDTSIAFSHWKTQNQRENEVNDVYASYMLIIKKLRSIRKRKNIIVIEDLDRIVDKSIIIGFLKELYRFQNLLSKKEQKKFVFIVAVKPEPMLKNTESIFEIDDPNVYSKVFDIVVSLKPIHFEDYESVLLELIKSNPETKKNLEYLLFDNNDRKINNKLPDSFEWILKGENLTIRDLKERLNGAISTMVILKNKGYQGLNAINFKACAAVAYLENKYASDYYELIREERNFANLITESYSVKNEFNKGDQETELITIFNIMFGVEKEGKKDKGKFSEGFVGDLCSLIIEGTFDEDFRLYFYTYPDGSYIKTTDEKEVCNYLLLPNEAKDFTNLDERMKRIESRKQSRKNSYNIIEETMRNMNVTPGTPRVTVYNDILLKDAAKLYPEQVVYTLLSETNDPQKYTEYIEIWRRLNRVEINGNVLKKYIDVWAPDLVKMDKELIIKIREVLIDCFGENILKWKNIFWGESINGVYPLITNAEMEKIANIDVSIKLVNPDNINNSSELAYICDKINSEKLSDEAYEIAVRIYSELLDKEEIGKYLLDFLNVNLKTNDNFFAVICKKKLDVKNVCEYVNQIESVKLTNQYLKLINNLGIEDGLKEDVLQDLKDNNYYLSLMLTRLKQNRLEKVEFNNIEDMARMKEDLDSIYEMSESKFIEIRKFILKDDSIDTEEFEALFYGGYPIISSDELGSEKNPITALKFLNREKIDEQNCGYIAQYCNTHIKGEGQISSALKSLFSEEYSDLISSNEICKKLFYSLDFKQIKFNEIGRERQEKVVGYIFKPLELNQPAEAVRFLRHVGCLIESIEKEAQKVSPVEEYIELINELNASTDETINWIEAQSADIPMNDKIAEKFLLKKEYSRYIIGKSLFVGELSFELNKVELEQYVKVYINADNKMLSIMSGHWLFLESVMDQDMFIKFDIEHLRPMYKVPQQLKFIKFIFENYDDVEKILYLESIGKFQTEKDSKGFQTLICKKENIELLGNWALFSRIYENLWESAPTHKQLFRRAWNKRWKKKELDFSALD